MTLIHGERPSGNRAEARMYDLLASSLNDEWQVWHEPEIRRVEDEERPYRPDFILLHPRRGLFVLEVKGWRLDRIRDILPGKKGRGGQDKTLVLYAFDEEPTEVEAPLEQLGKYLREIRRKLKGHSEVLEISAKKLSSIFDGAVVFTNIERSEAEYAGEDSFEQQRKKILTSKKSCRAAYKSEINSWKNDTRLLERTLSADRDANLALTPGQMDLIRGIVHDPESRLLSPPRPRELVAEVAPKHAPQELRVLSQEQENIARYPIGSGHRVLFGVAGSGKTIILIARARWQAMLSPECEILVLCFNRSLSLYIAKVLECYKNIHVMTFHAWVRERLEFEADFNEKEYGTKLLAHLNEISTDKYDSILIDECQDWKPEWFRAVLHAARDPKGGDLLIVGDGSQSIYREQGGFRWEDCGIKPQPWRVNGSSASLVLERSYRSTQKIVALASSFARGGADTWDDSGKDIPSLLPDPCDCYREDGLKPKLARFNDRKSEMAFVAKQVQGLIKTIDSLEPCDFTVIYPARTKPDDAEEKYRALTDKLNAENICCEHIRGGAIPVRNQERLITGNSVKLVNVQQFKGLEQRVCFIVGVEEFKDEDDKLLYVAMTRATDWLFLSWSGGEETGIINRLTAEPSLYSRHGDPQPMAVTDSKQSSGVAKLTINEILECLNAQKIRCAYTALAKYLGIEAKDVGQKLGPRRPEASWIVNSWTHEPTGYSPHELAPDLFTNNRVISTEAELRQLLDNYRSDQN